MIIAVDLDEVLGDFMNAYLRFYNDRHNTSWRRDQFLSYNFWETFGTTKEHMLDLLEQFIATEHFLSIEPFEEAIDGIRQLQREHTLILVTSRTKEMEEETLRWLDEHFPGAFDRVHVSNQFGQLGDWRSKAEICVDENADLIIEDNTEYASECAEAGVPVLLVDAPWNKNTELHEDITRVHTWKEILREIKRKVPSQSPR